MHNPVASDAEFVMDSAEYVTINSQCLREFADEHADNEYEIPEWNAPVFPSSNQNRQTIIDFMMLGNVLNFCFNDLNTGEKWAVEHMDTEWRGAFGMWASLHRNMPDILDAEFLASMSTADAEQIFESSNGVTIPMLEQRVSLIQDTGKTLLNKYNGTFATLVDESGGLLYNDGDGFVEQLIANFDGYKDTREYNGQTIRFDKRAQLAACMLYGKFRGNSETLFDDTDKLTLFADYGIPLALRSEGITEYSSSLADRVDSGQHIPVGSSEEVEIRAATVVVGERLMEEMNRVRSDSDVLTAPQMDYFLWEMRQESKGRAHITETTAY